MLNKNKFLLMLVLCTISLISGFRVLVEAQDSQKDLNIISRDEWGVDTSLVLHTSDRFAEPKRLVLVNVNPAVQSKGGKLFMRDLLYFFSFKMGLGDLPFHYVIDGNMDLYEGNGGGSDIVLPLEGIERGDVVIAYTGSIEQNASNIATAIKQVAYISKVDPQNMIGSRFIVELDQSKHGAKVKLQKLDKQSGLESFVSAIRDKVSDDFEVPQRKYNVDLEKVEYDKSAKPGSTTKVQVIVKNTGNSNIYYDSPGELFVTTDKDFNHDSKLYDSKTWDTKSRTSIMSSDRDTLLVGKGGVFDFVVQLPLEQGDVSETFVITNRNGDKFEDTQFEVNFKLDLGDLDVLEIKETETGFLRVRKSSKFGSEEIAKVLPGERFVYLERSDAGMFKIRLKDGREGWISAAYAKVVH